MPHAGCGRCAVAQGRHNLTKVVQRYRDAVNRCDFVGFHFYGATEFDPVVYEIVGALTGHFPGKLWIATEYGLNYPYDGDPTAQKHNVAPDGPAGYQA